MPRHMEKRILPYMPAQLFALVADVESYPSFLPWCQSVRVLRREEDRLKVIMQVGYKSLRDTFTSLVTLDPDHKIDVSYAGGPLKDLKNTWQFAPVEGGCEVTFFVAFSFKSVMLGALMDMFFDHAFRKMVSSFEARACDLYGKGRI